MSRRISPSSSMIAHLAAFQLLARFAASSSLSATPRIASVRCSPLLWWMRRVSLKPFSAPLTSIWYLSSRARASAARGSVL